MTPRVQSSSERAAFLCFLTAMMAQCAGALGGCNSKGSAALNRAAALAECFGDQTLAATRVPEDTRTFAVSLRVVAGRDVHLMTSLNPTVTLVNGKVSRVRSPPIRGDALYLHGVVTVTARKARRLYTYTVRITHGPLAGAVVRLCDGRVPDRILDPYQALYEIRHLGSVPTGEVPAELVDFWAK